LPLAVPMPLRVLLPRYFPEACPLVQRVPRCSTFFALPPASRLLRPLRPSTSTTCPLPLRLSPNFQSTARRNALSFRLTPRPHSPRRACLLQLSLFSLTPPTRMPTPTCPPFAALPLCLLPTRLSPLSLFPHTFGPLPAQRPTPGRFRAWGPASAPWGFQRASGPLAGVRGAAPLPSLLLMPAPPGRNFALVRCRPGRDVRA